MPMKANLSDDSRHQIVCFLLEHSKQEKPKHGKISEVTSMFSVTPRAIYNIWKKAKAQKEEGLAINVMSTIKGKQGRAKLVFPREKILTLDMEHKTTQSRIAKALGVSESSVQRWVKKRIMRSHSNALKPDLTTDNKLLRLNFVISKLFFDRLLQRLKFKDMGNMIHIDEKWFNMCKPSQNFYLLPEEVDPHRSCKNKRYITKVMFMAAVARPRYNEEGECIFDGKIGIWPFTFQEPAKRKSKNRPAGTIEAKPIESVNKLAIKHMILTNVIPAIKLKWPREASKSIVIQQDNARPHINGADGDFVAAARADGFDISLTQQPPNSPDLNILDLGFFRSISALQLHKPSKTVSGLIKNVEDAFEEMDASVLDNVWLSLKACMTEIMKRRSHNDYRLPHLGKESLQGQGLLPKDLSVDESLVKECMEFLIAIGATCNLQDLMVQFEALFPN